MAQAPCSCIKGKYDFYINEINCDKILYEDLSLWMEGDNYTIPEKYEIEFYNLDSAGESILLKKIEVSGLGITDISKLLLLKDGVFEIKTVSCQNTYKRWIAIMPKLQCCLDKYLASDEYDKLKHQEAQRLMDGARTTAMFNQPKKAIEFYRMAKKLIDVLKCDC